jgi:hypothetical protein
MVITCRLYDQEQWDVVFFLSGICEMVLLILRLMRGSEPAGSGGGARGFDDGGGLWS